MPTDAPRWTGDYGPCVVVRTSEIASLRSITLPDFPDEGVIHSVHVDEGRLHLGVYYGSSTRTLEGVELRDYHGRITEVRSDGEFSVRWQWREARAPVSDGRTVRAFEEVWSPDGPDPDIVPEVDVSFVWHEIDSRRVLLRVPLMARWPWACGLRHTQFHTSADGTRLWFFRFAGCTGEPDFDPAVVYRVHSWAVTPGEIFAVETTPPEGVPLRGYPLTGDQMGTTWGLSDGSLWMIAVLPGTLPGDEVLAVRAVLLGTDGIPRAISAPLIDPAFVDTYDGSTVAYGAWGRPTSDGGYVGHVVRRTSVSELSRESAFFRVERDGSTGWMVSAPPTYLAAAGPNYTDTNLALQRDGIAAMLDEPGSSDHVLFAVERDGTLRWPTGGPRLDTDPDLFRMARFTADEEHFFVVRVGEPAQVSRYAADTGTEDWPDGAAQFGNASQPERDVYWLPLADGLGGVFIAWSRVASAGVQHVDHRGRPLFGTHREHCEWGGYESTPIEFDRP